MGKFNLKIDSKRPYGEIHPQLDGALFEQDGMLFGPNGDLLEDRLTQDQFKALEQRQARADADKAAEAARRKALKAAGIDPDGNNDETDNPSVNDRKARKDMNATATATDGPDLAKWARGSIQMPFDKVQAAIRETYGRQVVNVRDAIDFAGEALNIPADELRAA